MVARIVRAPHRDRIGGSHLFSIRSMLRSLAVALTLAPMALLTASTAAEERGQGDWIDLGNGVLRDGATGLQWTRNDNGRDVDWEDAKAFCAAKGGDWRLPGIEELAGLYNEAKAGHYSAACAATNCKASPLFNLSGTWFWSGTAVGTGTTDAFELAWGLLLVNGVRTQALRNVSYGARAMCVRSS